MKALTWLVGLAIALAVLKVSIQAALVLLALGLLLAFARAPRETFAVLAGLMLLGLFTKRPELGLWFLTVVVIASRPWKK